MHSGGKFQLIEKRDGALVPFNLDKITEAIYRAAKSVGGENRKLAEELAHKVVIHLHRVPAKKPFHVEEIQDAVERILIENGHAKTAKAFILYREKRSRARAVRGEQSYLGASEMDITSYRKARDLEIQVRTTNERVLPWDRERIVEALRREAGLRPAIAQRISRDVEQQIVYGKMSVVTTALVRELVNAKLVEYGLIKESLRHLRLGVPLYDAEQIITGLGHKGPSDPAAADRELAESVTRQFALQRVFSSEVADAHFSGDLHLHNLGLISRGYSARQGIEGLKKSGMSLPGALLTSGPARHGETLMAHVVRLARALQGHCCNKVEWGHLNLALAPFVAGWDKSRVQQLAQWLIYEFSQGGAAGTGDLPVRHVLHLYWDVPGDWGAREALGPGGHGLGTTYGELADEAQRIAMVFMELFGELDGPLGAHLVIHRESSGQFSNEFADCCRALLARGRSLSLRPLSWPSNKRQAPVPYFAVQRTSINLPRLAYVARGDDEALLRGLDRIAELCVRGHCEKRAFMGTLLAQGEEGPLSFLSQYLKGELGLEAPQPVYLVGFVGFNEMIEAHTGYQLHEQGASTALVERILKRLSDRLGQLARQHGLILLLDGSENAEASERLGRLDLLRYRHETSEVDKSEVCCSGHVYTDSVYLNRCVAEDTLERIERELELQRWCDVGSGAPVCPVHVAASEAFHFPQGPQAEEVGRLNLHFRSRAKGVAPCYRSNQKAPTS